MLVALAGPESRARIAVAAGLATTWAAAGERVLLVDLDPAGALRRWSDRALALGRTSAPALALGHAPPPPSLLRELAAGFALTLVETSADRGRLASVLEVADLALVVVPGPAPELDALAETWSIVDQARKRRPRLRAHAVFPEDPERAPAAHGLLAAPAARPPAARGSTDELADELHRLAVSRRLH